HVKLTRDCPNIRTPRTRMSLYYLELKTWYPNTRKMKAGIGFFKMASMFSGKSLAPLGVVLIQFVATVPALKAYSLVLSAGPIQLTLRIRSGARSARTISQHGTVSRRIASTRQKVALRIQQMRLVSLAG